MAHGALDAGALHEAWKNCEHSLKIRREINDRADIGKTLANFGNVQLQQADLDGARASLEESLSSLESVSAKNDAAYTRIFLARLALEQRKTDEAGKIAGDAATEFAVEKDGGGEDWFTTGKPPDRAARPEPALCGQTRC